MPSPPPPQAARESALLAPYAMHSADSRGRRRPEPEHPYRSCFQRDRDRILHSHAFRRLAGKMQVFTGEHGDYHRTRLTHTQEVASLARTVGRALRLNEDLIEALAYLHDLGHPPYGHAGEAALHACLAEVGGFSHNRFALTLVEEIEQRYPDYPGLNLSLEVLESQASRAERGRGGPRPLLEAQVVEAADSAAYDAHDVDDAVKLGLIELDELAEARLVRELLARVRREIAGGDEAAHRKALVHALIDRQSTDVIETAARALAEHAFPSADAARACAFTLGPSRELAEQKSELEALLYRRVYRHEKLIAFRSQAQARLRAAVEGYVARPDLLPEKYQQRAASAGLLRTAGEYVAGMTDRFFEDHYRRLFANLAAG